MKLLMRRAALLFLLAILLALPAGASASGPGEVLSTQSEALDLDGLQDAA